ncbi:MAG: hypothetical protein WCW68_11565 [Methanothrix sp.]
MTIGAQDIGDYSERGIRQRKDLIFTASAVTQEEDRVTIKSLGATAQPQELQLSEENTPGLFNQYILHPNVPPAGATRLLRSSYASIIFFFHCGGIEDDNQDGIMF